MIKQFVSALFFFVAATGTAAAQRAVIRGLDKATGHAQDYTLTLNRSIRIGSLEVVARACDKAAPEETPEVRIYVEVFDHPPARAGEETERREIFRGWMFASSPGLNAVDHPTYDIWAVDCRS